LLKNLISKSNSTHNAYIEAFNHRVSQKEVEELALNRTDLYKKLALKGKKHLIEHLQLVDVFIQDAVLVSTFDKYIIVDNKIVNKYDYINSNINPDWDYQKQKEEEIKISSKLKHKTLQQYLDENLVKGKPDLSKLDKESIYNFENAVRLESKKIIGNMSTEDSYAIRWGIIGAVFMKFKTWFPELANTFFGGVSYREEGKRFEAGRFRSIGAIMIAAPNSESENIGKVMYEWFKDQFTLAITSALEIYNLKNSSTVAKNLEIRYVEYVRDLKDNKITDIPTKKEYIDLRIQEAKNGMNFLATMGLVYILGNVFSVLAGDDDDKESWTYNFLESMGLIPDNTTVRALFKALSMFTHKGLLELYTFTSASGLLSTVTKLTLPQLAAAGIAVRGVYSALTSSIYALSGGNIFDNNIKYTMEAIPIIRPVVKDAVILSKDTEFGEDLQEILNVDERYRKKRKTE